MIYQYKNNVPSKNYFILFHILYNQVKRFEGKFSDIYVESMIHIYSSGIYYVLFSISMRVLFICVYLNMQYISFNNYSNEISNSYYFKDVNWNIDYIVENINWKFQFLFRNADIYTVFINGYLKICKANFHSHNVV